MGAYLSSVNLDVVVWLAAVSVLAGTAWGGVVPLTGLLLVHQLLTQTRNRQRRLVQQKLDHDHSTQPFSVGSSLMLRSGRQLGYLVHGVKDRSAVRRTLIYLHGTPGSRHEVYPDESLLTNRGIQMIVVDRCGFGLSTYDPARTRESFAEDISELLSHLDVRECAMLGFSGGGAYVLACLAHERLSMIVTSATLVATEGPYLEYEAPLIADIRRDSPVLWTLSQLVLRGGGMGPILLRWWFEYEQYCFLSDTPAFMKKKYGARIAGPPRPDAPEHEVKEQQALYAMLQRTHASVWLEPFKSSGVQAIVHDCIVAKTAWKTPLEEIGHRTRIHFWHGEKDTLRSIEVSKYMAKRMTSAQSVTTHWIPNAGHALFLRRDNWEQMLDQIVDGGAANTSPRPADPTSPRSAL